MKLILSRKGFDSGSGGCANPILSDGRLVSLPIPDSDSPMRYADCFYHKGHMGGLVEKLTKKKIRRNSGAHLDPDIDPIALAKRDPAWRPLFGQHGAAQGHLQKQAVGVGDLFLFFGWFREFDGHAFVKGAPDLHVLFGYFQIERILEVEKIGPEDAWMLYHPHCFGTRSGRNVLYIAKDRLDIPGLDGNLPGAGLFPRFDPLLCLTQAGQRRGIWRLPSFFRTPQQCLSYHKNTERWRTLDDGDYELDSAFRGQEFVLDLVEQRDAASRWIAQLLSLYSS